MTEENSEEPTNEQFDALCRLFYPFVEAALRPKIEAEMKEPYLLDEKKVENFFYALKNAPPELQEACTKRFEKMREQIQVQEFAGPEEIELVVKEESRFECEQMIRHLIDVLHFCATKKSPVPPYWTIELTTLDDAMLPPLDLPMPEGEGTGAEFFKNLCDGILDDAEIRIVLSQVKATLPPDHRLPADLVEYLRLGGTTVRS